MLLALVLKHNFDIAQPGMHCLGELVMEISGENEFGVTAKLKHLVQLCAAAPAASTA